MIRRSICRNVCQPRYHIQIHNLSCRARGGSLCRRSCDVTVAAARRERSAAGAPGEAAAGFGRRRPARAVQLTPGLMETINLYLNHKYTWRLREARLAHYSERSNAATTPGLHSRHSRHCTPARRPRGVGLLRSCRIMAPAASPVLHACRGDGGGPGPGLAHLKAARRKKPEPYARSHPRPAADVIHRPARPGRFRCCGGAEEERSGAAVSAIIEENLTTKSSPISILYLWMEFIFKKKKKKKIQNHIGTVST